MTVEERIKKTKADYEKARRNMPDYWDDDFFEYWEKFDAEHEERAIGRRFIEDRNWSAKDCRRLCELAGIEDEWDTVDGEDAKQVVRKAAEILNVPI